jgi:hypothetical protein
MVEKWIRPACSISHKVSVDRLKAFTYFVALLRAILSWFAVWVLLKLSVRHCCKSFRILYAGKAACGMSNSDQETAGFSETHD